MREVKHRAEARKSAMNIQVSRTYRVTRKIGHLGQSFLIFRFTDPPTPNSLVLEKK